MLKKLLLGCGLLSLATTASAQWIGGIGYFDLTADVEGYETSPDLWGINIGYELDTPIRDLIITPGFSLYGGIDDDIVKVNSPTTSKVRVETQFGMGLNVRFQWEGDDNIYFYVAPAYTRFDIEGREGDVRIEDDEWQAGIGAGIGYNVTSEVRVEVSFEEYGDSDILGLALRYKF